jgi:hypothetical protein
MLTVLMTLYGWPDNSPPGNGIEYPQIHMNGAGGTGTYSDPITFATDQSEEAPGTIIYVPAFLKYGIMEDGCTACSSDWSSGMKYHFDFWLNSDGSANGQAVQNCEGMWTKDATVVEIGPPPGRMVDTTPLFNIQTNTCSTTP